MRIFHTARMLDLSSASSAELRAAPVLLNGAPVLFDFKVALVPLQLEMRSATHPESAKAQPIAQDERLYGKETP